MKGKGTACNKSESLNQIDFSKVLQSQSRPSSKCASGTPPPGNLSPQPLSPELSRHGLQRQHAAQNEVHQKKNCWRQEAARSASERVERRTAGRGLYKCSSSKLARNMSPRADGPSSGDGSGAARLSVCVCSSGIGRRNPKRETPQLLEGACHSSQTLACMFFLVVPCACELFFRIVRIF